MTPHLGLEYVVLDGGVLFNFHLFQEVDWKRRRRRLSVTSKKERGYRLLGKHTRQMFNQTNKATQMTPPYTNFHNVLYKKKIKKRRTLTQFYLLYCLACLRRPYLVLGSMY